LFDGTTGKLIKDSGILIVDLVATTDPRLDDDRIAYALRSATVKDIDNSVDPTDGQTLTYNAASGKWKFVTPTGGGGGGGGAFGPRGLTFAFKDTAGLSLGRLVGYYTCPVNGTISAWSLNTDAGTLTIKFWKVAGALPTSGNSINTSGLTTSGHSYSTTVTDFTTLAVTRGDVFAVEITAKTGSPQEISGSLEVTPTGASGAQYIGETPSGSINGSNQNFTLAHTLLSGTLAVYLNGMRQKVTDDYTITSSTVFQMVTAPLTGDKIIVDYQS